MRHSRASGATVLSEAMSRMSLLYSRLLPLMKLMSPSQSSGVEETEKSVAMVKDELDILRRMFGNFDYGKFITGSELEQLETLNEGAELMQGTKDRETLFMGHTKKLKAAFDMCLSSEEITDKDRGDIHYFCGVRSII